MPPSARDYSNWKVGFRVLQVSSPVSFLFFHTVQELRTRCLLSVGLCMYARAHQWWLFYLSACLLINFLFVVTIAFGWETCNNFRIYLTLPLFTIIDSSVYWLIMFCLTTSDIYRRTVSEWVARCLLTWIYLTFTTLLAWCALRDA